VADIVDAATRSRMMSGIRSRHTKPERIVRSGLHRLGYRFALHSRKLKGTPDLVLPKYRAVIFVHGCFWHGHECRLFRMPGTRTEFWKTKIGRNRLNDESARKELAEQGWRVLVIWECTLRGRSEKEIASLLQRASVWLRTSRRSLELREPRRKAA
jgi:DNA mismatch endonuclease (patch repair protein)